MKKHRKIVTIGLLFCILVIPTLSVYAGSIGKTVSGYGIKNQSAGSLADAEEKYEDNEESNIQKSRLIEYENASYYWELDISDYSDAVYCHKMWGPSFDASGEPTSLVKLASDGTRTELLQVNGGVGEIYYINDMLFFQYGNWKIGSCKTDGSEFTSYGVGRWLGADRVTGDMYGSAEENFKVSKDGKTELTMGETQEGYNQNILCVENGVAIYEKRKSGRNIGDDEPIILGCYDFATGEDSELYYDDDTDGICGSYGASIVNKTIHGDYFYFLYGGYGGSAEIFYGGKIARVNLHTHESELLVNETIEENFFILENETGQYLYYCSNDEMKRLDLETREVTVGDDGTVSVRNGVVEEKTDEAAIWYEYDEKTGARQILLTSDDYVQYNPTDRDRSELAAGERYLAVENVTGTNSYVYYELFLVQSDGGTSTWYADTLKGIGAFRKSKKDGTTTILYRSGEM